MASTTCAGSFIKAHLILTLGSQSVLCHLQLEAFSPLPPSILLLITGIDLTFNSFSDLLS